VLFDCRRDALPGPLATGKRRSAQNRNPAEQRAVTGMSSRCRGLRRENDVIAIEPVLHVPQTDDGEAYDRVSIQCRGEVGSGPQTPDALGTSIQA